MAAPRKIDMKAVTALTRQGRLKEAMSILGGALFGAPQPGPEKEGAGDAATVIDMTPPTAAGQAWRAPETDAAADSGPHSETDPVTAGVHTLIDRMRDFTPPHFTPGSFTPPDFDTLPGMAGLRPAARVRVPEGGSFEDYSFANDAGSRPYKLYVPSGYHGQSVPLIVMLHGCTQSPDDFAAGTRMNEVAEAETFLVAYPGQTKSGNSQKCWNWYNPADQVRDAGEPSLIAGITRQIIATFNVDVTQVFVAGLSAGGAQAAIMGAAYPELYAAVGVHSGLACGAARDMPSAFAAMRQGAAAVHKGKAVVPTIVFHSDDDRTVHPANADQVVLQARGTRRLHATTTTGTSQGGMGYTRTVMADDAGLPVLEQWTLHGAGHTWSGGSPEGSFTSPSGPDASREMLRFFLQQKRG
ncbi:MAG: extracellular catalytic domain type 1 short-chain-length polyhydroxyalkanoate depolymerase [Asticcacaulis sp.]